MRLPDGSRQIAAGLLAALTFLLLYFGLGLVWWAALVGGIAGFGAGLLIIQRRRPLEEIRLSDRVSAADISSAAEALADAQSRLDAAAKQAPDADAGGIAEMAGHVGSIRNSVMQDPEDYRHARRFITFYLPNIVKTVETYARLTGQARGANAERLTGMSDQIRGFGQVVERIDAACLENDLRALEIEVEVLSDQLDRVQ